MYDLVIAGSGPAGMTAAIYGVRANLKVLLLDRLAPGGQLVNTNEIENYPGVGKINGAELAMNMYEHCMSLGVEFDYATVTNVEEVDGKKLIHTEEREEPIEARSVILAMGTTPRKLNIPGEEQLAGSSVSWCAICDGAKYRDKDVVIVGGGNSAVDEGIFLAGIVNKLTVITDFDLTSDPVQADYLRSLDNVTVHPYKKVDEFRLKDGKLEGVAFQDKEGGNEDFVPCDGVFEYIGAIPRTEFLEGTSLINEFGYIEVDEKMATSIPGVFGAGDCTVKNLRQVSTAISDGAIAGHEASVYLKHLDAQNN